MFTVLVQPNCSRFLSTVTTHVRKKKEVKVHRKKVQFFSPFPLQVIGTQQTSKPWHYLQTVEGKVSVKASLFTLVPLLQLLGQLLLRGFQILDALLQFDKQRNVIRVDHLFLPGQGSRVKVTQTGYTHKKEQSSGKEEN